MAFESFEPFSEGLPGRGQDEQRVSRPRTRPYQRSFRCRSTLVQRRPAAAPMTRFEEFMTLHESMSGRPEVDLRRLWWSGLGAALVAAAMTFTGVMVMRGVFGIQVPIGGGDLAPHVAGATYAVCAVAATLQATALLHVLIAVAARPVRAFAWIGGMAVLIVTLLPLTLQGPIDAALATAAINLAGGAVIVGLLSSVANSALRWPPDDAFPF
ncbi:hypothetical protein J4573_33150 [Actinomadura barringtoniae]|uniref:Uncharacterized protein n=1 Tax=Actinomadura barringtoniae TaxID=1427535 RepID=A0A939TD62_9ACTN|nr:DUF6069 family protein [Actinomadura barringtoniae]MBO2451975.1 hypothetical protein [Actinomadura barringtoniae]